jgi:hypothetical protein
LIEEKKVNEVLKVVRGGFEIKRRKYSGEFRMLKVKHGQISCLFGVGSE